jgi:hypothetical protein
MKIRIRTSDLPGRISTGAYILHSGLEKWGADGAHAQGLDAMAAGAFPFLRRIPPMRFGRFLAAGEIGTGAALLNPLVPVGLAGGALSIFSGALLAMYLRTPAMHQEGSVWPSPAGSAVSKDVFILGIGLGLMVEAATERKSL